MMEKTFQSNIMKQIVILFIGLLLIFSLKAAASGFGGAAYGRANLETNLLC